jgi:hypothetical protein
MTWGYIVLKFKGIDNALHKELTYASDLMGVGHVLKVR